MDQWDLLEKFGIPKTFQEYLRDYFLPKQVDGDDYCYYGSIFEGLMHGLDEREIKLLELNGIVDTKSFHTALARYFKSKNGDKQDSIYVKRNNPIKQKEVPLTDRIRKSLLEGPSCPESWGTTDMNDIVSGFFYEMFGGLKIEIVSLFQTKQGWRWNRKRDTEITLRPNVVLHIFLLKSENHFDALLPTGNSVVLAYSYPEKKSDKKMEDDIDLMSDGEEIVDNEMEDDIIDLTMDELTDEGKKKRQETKSKTGLGKHIRFDSSDDDDSDDDSDNDSDNDDYKRKKRKTVRALYALKF